MKEKEDRNRNLNRTGIRTSPFAAATAAGAETAAPSSEGGDLRVSHLRADYAAQAGPVGSVASVLLDKLGERLAFERTGARLYQAVMDKLEAIAPETTRTAGPTFAELEEIQEDELRHFELVREAIEELGGDATAMTPSADVAGVATSGVLQVASDPRTRLPECLQALLTAELVDNDGWELLVELADALGHVELTEAFREAALQEHTHLQLVRRWLSEHVLANAGVAGAREERQAPAD